MFRSKHFSTHISHASITSVNYFSGSRLMCCRASRHWHSFTHNLSCIRCQILYTFHPLEIVRITQEWQGRWWKRHKAYLHIYSVGGGDGGCSLLWQRCRLYMFLVGFSHSQRTGFKVYFAMVHIRPLMEFILLLLPKHDDPTYSLMTDLHWAHNLCDIAHIFLCHLSRIGSQVDRMVLVFRPSNLLSIASCKQLSFDV